MLESSIEEWKESWKILRKRPFDVYITLCTCIGLALLGHYTGTIIRLLCIQDDFQSLLKEVFLGPSIVWSVFGAVIGCWTNGYPAETIWFADCIIFTSGMMVKIFVDVDDRSDDASLFVAKLLVGVGIGMISMACPRYYISHASVSTSIGGSLVRLHCFYFAVGGCVSFCYGLFATTKEPERTAYMISVTRFPAILQLCLTISINPESPFVDCIKFLLKEKSIYHREETISTGRIVQLSHCQV